MMPGCGLSALQSLQPVMFCKSQESVFFPSVCFIPHVPFEDATVTGPRQTGLRSRLPLKRADPPRTGRACFLSGLLFFRWHKGPLRA